MREAIAVVGLLALAGGVAALRAVLDGRRIGVPASIAVLAPAAEAARLLRMRAAGVRPVVGALLLLASPVVRVLALPIASTALGAPVGIGWLVVADLVWWIGGALLVRQARFALRAAAVEMPLLLVLAVPVVAARSPAVGAVVTAQLELPFGAEAPVALLLLLGIGGVLLPWAVQPTTEALGGTARLLAAVGTAAQPVATAAVGTVLFLGVDVGAARLLLLVVVLSAAIVLAARRFPVLGGPRIRRLALTVLLPLSAVQLAIVAALTLLART